MGDTGPLQNLTQLRPCRSPRRAGVFLAVAYNCTRSHEVFPLPGLCAALRASPDREPYRPRCHKKPQPTWLGIGKCEARLVRSLGDCSPRWRRKVRRAFENIPDTPKWHSGPQSAEGAIPLGQDWPQSLMQLAAKLSHALAELDADLRAGGFGQNCRGLAGEFYASFTATIIATRGTRPRRRHGPSATLWPSTCASPASGEVLWRCWRDLSN